jgi:penicillin-binding protein 1A
MSNTNENETPQFKKAIRFFWAVVLTGILSVFIFFYGLSEGWFGFMPSFEDLENPKTDLATEVISNDNVLLGKYYHLNRTFVSYDELPHELVNALIATEDVRFYDHSGIDVRGLFRVLKGVLTGSTSSGGGSTITQQLAKMLFPREKNQTKIELVVRKFREWVIAVKLERSYTKEEIIAMYFNKFDFLNLAVGVKSASQIYFNTIPEKLSQEKAAMLVGMAKNPAYFNPLRRPRLTFHRRNVVLFQMFKYGYIKRVAYDSLKVKPLGLDFKRSDHKEGLATYFREHLRVLMTAGKPEKKHYSKWDMASYTENLYQWTNNPLYGWCNKNFKNDGSTYDIYRDGLKIHASLDSRLQRYAEEAVKEHLALNLQKAFDKEKRYKKRPPFSNDLSQKEVNDNIMLSIKRCVRYRLMKKAGKNEEQILASFDKANKIKVFTWKGIRDTIMSPKDSIKYYKGFLRAGFMSMNPHNGHVKAYVGGPDYTHFMYDMVSQGKRQVGSIIKPILYTLAMKNGLTPCDKVLNLPQTFILSDGTPWASKNSYSKRQGEMVTLKWGLAHSVNNISGWVLKQFSPKAAVDMAKKLGIRSRIDPVPSLFLGTADISVKEMVSAYCTFANKGVHASPILVTRIDDKYGNPISTFNAPKKEVIKERTAYLMLNLLQGVVKTGTGIRLRFRYGLENAIGGKTGTTQNHSDGWFMGVTPDLVSGVWVGAEDRAVHFQGIALGQGANMALPIWAIYMKKAYADETLKLSQENFEVPRGMNANINCKETVKVKGDSLQDVDEDDEFF